MQMYGGARRYSRRPLGLTFIGAGRSHDELTAGPRRPSAPAEAARGHAFVNQFVHRNRHAMHTERKRMAKRSLRVGVCVELELRLALDMAASALEVLLILNLAKDKFVWITVYQKPSNQQTPMELPIPSAFTISCASTT